MSTSRYSDYDVTKGFTRLSLTATSCGLGTSCNALSDAESTGSSVESVGKGAEFDLEDEEDDQLQVVTELAQALSHFKANTALPEVGYQRLIGSLVDEMKNYKRLVDSERFETILEFILSLSTCTDDTWERWNVTYGADQSRG